ncbi:MAG: BTAD domain-containing putative transcriptional regulator [Caldilineaceae bacterium]
MAYLRIHLLGNCSLLYGDTPLSAPDSPRLQSIFAYLLLHSSTPQFRQQLAFQLWPESSEPQAYRNLRKAIHQLRRTSPLIDQYLQVTTRTIHWHPAFPYTLDVSEFEVKVRQAQETMGIDSATRQTLLTEAVALYQGDLLPNCYDEWIIPARERLRQQWLETLERLVWVSEDRRDYATALHYAHHLLRAEPLAENTYQQLMRLHALTDDRAAALQTYHTCITVLQRELGVEPGAALQAAYTQLLAATIPASLRPAPPSAPAGALRLVGRQAEWQRLRTLWQQTAQGQTHFCLLHGEAGIGKTRLAEEVRDWGARQGIITATTRSYAAEGALAYAPVVEWLRAPPLQTALATLAEPWLTEVARLLPELLVEQPTLPRPAPLTAEWQRQRLFEALARAFTSDGQPKLLLIDDLQWCDGETLAWLRYLRRFAGSSKDQPPHPAPLLILGTVRSEEIDADHPLTTLLLDLRRNDEISELTLTPFNERETAELAAQIISTPLLAEAAQTIYHQSEGNPLFVVEMMRSGVESWRTGDGAAIASRPSLPPKVQSVIQQRLNHLSPAARQLLGLAATIGRSFSFALLQQASNHREEELVHWLDELWQRGLVREQGLHTYDFSHDRIREAAYALVSPAQRPLWHKRVVQALEALYVDDLDGVSAQIATHYERAGLASQAITHYQRAAAVEVRRFAHNNAIVYLDSGLILLRMQPPTIERAKQELTLLLTKAYSLAVVQGFSVPDIAAVCAQIETLLPHIDEDRLRFHAYQRLRGYYASSGKTVEAYRCARYLLEVAQRLADPAYRLGAFQANGIVNLQLGHFAVGRDYMEQGQALYRSNGADAVRHAQSDTGMIGLTGNLVLTLWLLGHPDQAKSKQTDALAFAEKLNDPFQTTIILFFATMVYSYCYAVEATAAAAQKMLRLDAQYGFPLTHASGLVSDGWAVAQQGNLAEGIRRMRAGIDEMNAMNHLMFQTHRLAWLAETQLQAADWAAAGATLDEAFTMSDQSGQRSADAELYRLRGEWLLRSAGSNSSPKVQAAAEAAFQQALTIARTQEAKSFELRAAMSLCRLWQRQGKRAEAYKLLAAIYGWFTEGFDTADLQEAKALLTAWRE